MITGHNENLPKNRFKALDELEKRENLDNYSGKDLQEGLIYPIVAYNEFFAFPFMNTDFSSAAVPILWSDSENEENRII